MAIMVEADTTDPSAFGRGTPKALLGVSADTRVLRIGSDGRATTLDWAALERGRFVRVWYADSVLIALTDPARAEAGVIVLGTTGGRP